MSATTRRLAIALAVSIALNLFLIGFMSARALSPQPPQPPQPLARHLRLRPPGPDAGLRPGRRAHARGGGFGRLGPRGEGAMAKHRGPMREHRAALRKAYAAVREALSAEPFDRAALEGALRALRDQEQQAQQQAHRALVDLASSVDAETRRKLSLRARRR